MKNKFSFKIHKDVRVDRNFEENYTVVKPEDRGGVWVESEI